MIDVHSIGTRLKNQNLGGETIYKESVWLLEPMGNEGVNVTWKFTDRKYYIVAQIIEKYIIGSKQTSIKKVN